MTHPIDVQEIMRAIRARIRDRGATQRPPMPPIPQIQPPRSPDWSRLERAAEALHTKEFLVGELPAAPPTWRGRVGSFLVQIVRRAIFWYTPQIHEFHRVVTRSFEDQLTMLKSVSAASQASWPALEEQNRQIESLRAETERLDQLIASREAEIRKGVQAELISKIQFRKHLESRLDEAVRKVGAIEIRLDLETGARQSLEAELDASRGRISDKLSIERDEREQLAQRLALEIAAREQLSKAQKSEVEAREALSRQIVSEMAAREDMERRLADLRGSLTQAAKAEAEAREGLAHGLAAEMAAREDVERRLADLRDSLTQAAKAEAEARKGLAHGLAAEMATREDLIREDMAGRLADFRDSLTQAAKLEAEARNGLALGLAAEMAARENVARRLDTEIGTREGLTQALGAEIGAREELNRGLIDEMRAREALAKRLDEEISALEWVTSAHNAETVAREALAGRVESEIQVRENLFRDLSAAVNRSDVLQGEFRQSGIRVEQLRAEVINQSRRVSILLEEARKRLPKPFDQEQLTTLAQEDMHALDAVYVSFEDRFRGSREEIKDRFRVYLPLLAGQKLGSAKMPILDVGCGRGEWLELLKAEKLKALGIDTNRVLLADCKEKGFDVAEDDILHYLRSLPDASMGAVTGFHIIEHLPLDVLIKVFDETVRVLKPGGMAIFETPNPRNVLVGSHNFYLDLTHRNPLPSLTIQFLLEARGLCDVRVLNLHPYPESAKVAEDGSDVAGRFNEYFYGPQDYAVIGRRA